MYGFNQSIQEVRGVLSSGNPQGILEVLEKCGFEEATLKYTNHHLEELGLLVTQNMGEWELREEPKFNSKKLQVDLQSLRDFLLGGRAKFTLKNTESKNRFLFGVLRPSYYVMDEAGKRTRKFYKYMVVALMTHQGGRMKYRQIGRLMASEEVSGYTFFHEGRHLANRKEETGIQAFEWMMTHLNEKAKGSWPSKIELWHTGHCGCCGRLLTDPESLQNGIGPICIKKIKDERGVTIPT